MDLAGKRILILGFAREGVSLARFLAPRSKQVTVTDALPRERLAERIESVNDESIRMVLGGDHPELIEETDLFFTSPGVPETNAVYRAAVQAGMSVYTMTTLFFDLCKGMIVGVTGSSGKTTTTGLIGEILRQAGRDVVLGGNIGEPMLDLLPRVSPQTVVVLELSSFQLATLRQSPHVAVVTNISPNHLDRHETMENYVRAKCHIVAHQSAEDVAVLNSNDALSAEFASATAGQIGWFGEGLEATTGATVKDESIGILQDGAFQAVMPVNDIPLLGRHNVANVLAALGTTSILGVGAGDMAAGVRTYRPAPHRLQIIADQGGVQYIDDSIATSPARAVVALQALNRPILLIAGGRDKQVPWDEFARLAVEKARALFLIGEAAPLIQAAILRVLSQSSGLLAADEIQPFPSLHDAVREASRQALPGEVVLLSPGCASYDMFRDFEERGNVFVEAIQALHAA